MTQKTGSNMFNSSKSILGILSATFLIVILFQEAFAADPSKKETANFILSKTGVVYTGSHWCPGKVDKKRRVEFSNDYCTLKTYFTVYNRTYGRTRKHGKVKCSDESISHVETERIYLKDVDPDRIQQADQGRSVMLNIREDKKLIKVTTDKINAYVDDDMIPAPLSHDSYSYVWTFNGEVNGVKLYRALKHLVKSCGGKGELF